MHIGHQALLATALALSAVLHWHLAIAPYTENASQTPKEMAPLQFRITSQDSNPKRDPLQAPPSPPHQDPAPPKQSPQPVVAPQKSARPAVAKALQKPTLAEHSTATPPPSHPWSSVETTKRETREREATVSYTTLVATKLNQVKRYPLRAKRKGQTGKIRLQLTVKRNGIVTNQIIIKSSGYATLDTEVLAMVARAQPFPAFPEEIPHLSLDITVPIVFSLTYQR